MKARKQFTDPNDVMGAGHRFYNSDAGLGRKQSGRPLYIEPAALKTLEHLNDYDMKQVSKSIQSLASIPFPIDGEQQTHRPDFFKAKQQSGTAGNFVIKYFVTVNAITITNIHLNLGALGPKPVSKNERASLYHVERKNGARFNSNMSLQDVERLEEAWRLSRPRYEVTTSHAAVNGMLNNLNKAAWLMGVHADSAYYEDNIKEFTLFHNPSESSKLDFYECVRDNLGFTTEVAQHLSAVLRDVQRKGNPVKWTVHSQGGILFKQAIKHHIKNYGGSPLDKNSVVFHAGGNNKKETQSLLDAVRIKKEAPDRDNPFDIVPNLAGRNDLSFNSVKRSIQFWNKVKGENNSSTAESPHTLPFISLEAYHRFLLLAGDTKSAGRVKQYMESM